MDRQLEPPILIRSIGSPSKISTLDTYNNLSAFIMSLPPSTSRTQLERLTDALGVECGVVDVSEEERREKERVKRREERRKARRLQREAEEAEAAAADADAGAAGASGALEDEHGQFLGKRKGRNRTGKDAEVEEEDEMEGGVGDGDEPMDDRGDVEYGDVPDEDEDEPDNEDARVPQEGSDE